MVPANEPSGFGPRLIQLYQEPLLGKRLAENARKSIEEKFNIQTTINE
jgi:hypothetical protein